MVKISRLEDIQIYNEALLLTKEIFTLYKSKQLLREYSLNDQIKRSSVSVAANIAEGYGRNTKTDFARFLSISLGSANETIALLDVINLSFDNLQTVPLRQQYLVLCKRIYALRRFLI